MSAMLFQCPTCGESVTVDEGMRDLLIAEGCVVCRSTVSHVDFEPR